MAGLAEAGLDTQKKQIAATERDPVERANWRQEHPRLKPTQLVFVDESGSHAALALRYGWAPRGERAHGQAPCNRGANPTLLAAITKQGLLATMTVEGAADTTVFLPYLDEVLCPVLRRGQTVLTDNLSVHKAAAVRERIEACGCRLVFLPRSSPDFNPIEGACSETEDVPAPGGGTHSGGARRRHRGRVGDHHRSRRPWLVHPLRLPFPGSLTLKVAVTPGKLWLENYSDFGSRRR